MTLQFNKSIRDLLTSILRSLESNNGGTSSANLDVPLSTIGKDVTITNAFNTPLGDNRLDLIKTTIEDNYSPFVLNGATKQLSLVGAKIVDTEYVDMLKVSLDGKLLVDIDIAELLQKNNSQISILTDVLSKLSTSLKTDSRITNNGVVADVVERNNINALAVQLYTNKGDLIETFTQDSIRLVPHTGTTSSSSTIMVANTAQVISNNGSRNSFEIQNNSTGNLYMRFGAIPTITNSFVLTPGSTFTPPANCKVDSIIYILGGTVGQSFHFIEYM
jgi:hypothetical protein